MARAGGLLSGLAWVLFALAPGPAWTLPLCLLAGLGFYMIHDTLQMQATQMAPTATRHRRGAVCMRIVLGQAVGMGMASWLIDRSSTTVVLAGYGIGLALIALVVGRMPPSAATPVRAQ